MYTVEEIKYYIKKLVLFVDSTFTTISASLIIKLGFTIAKYCT